MRDLKSCIAPKADTNSNHAIPIREKRLEPIAIFGDDEKLPKSAVNYKSYR